MIIEIEIHSHPSLLVYALRTLYMYVRSSREEVEEEKLWTKPVEAKSGADLIVGPIAVMTPHLAPVIAITKIMRVTKRHRC